MRLATFRCNPACQERRSTGQPCQCVLSQLAANPQSTGASQHHTQLTNVRAALTMGTRPNSDAVPLPRMNFLGFFCETELSLQSRAHFADLIFQKWSERSSFLTFWNANRALATVLCAFCQQLLQIEPRKCGKRGPIYYTHDSRL